MPEISRRDILRALADDDADDDADECSGCGDPQELDPLTYEDTENP